MLAVLVAMLPLTGFAQQIRSVSPVERASAMLQNVTADQALVIGVGVIGGAIGLHALLGGTVWTLAGGAAGAMVGNWWFVQHTGEVLARKGTAATLAAR